MHWSGLVQMLQQKYLTQKPKMEKEFTVVTLVQVMPVLIVLFSGALFAILVIFIERMSVYIYVTRRKLSLQM